MSLRYLTTVDAVLRGLVDEYPIFGDPQIRDDVTREIRSHWSPEGADNENREALARAAVAAIGNRPGYDYATADVPEFYAVNVLSMKNGAVTGVATCYVSVPANVPFDAMERFFGKDDGTTADGVAVLAVNVEFETIPSEIELMFLGMDGEHVTVMGEISAGNLRERRGKD